VQKSHGFIIMDKEDIQKRIDDIMSHAHDKDAIFLEYGQLDSTNDFLKRYVDEEWNNDDTVVVRAGFQTQGRGQFEREWISPPHKNLLFSILIKPHFSPSKAPLVTLLAAEAIVRTLQSLSDQAFEIKAPNDVMCNGKKIAGILSEEQSKGGVLQYLIVGIGINVNAHAQELPDDATSLVIEEGKSFNMHPIFLLLIEEFFTRYEQHYGKRKK